MRGPSSGQNTSNVLGPMLGVCRVNGAGPKNSACEVSQDTVHQFNSKVFIGQLILQDTY